MKALAQSPERSVVTVLVVDMVNSTGHIAGLDPDEAQELLDRIYDHLNGAVRRAGGIFVNYSGDGGVAMFGWPASLEEHADRACEAAWLIQLPALEGRPIRDSRGRTIRFRIGIHSGLVGLRRMDLDIGERLDPVGGTVHIAASLQKSAGPDNTLISSRALELCRQQHEVAPHEDLPVLTHIKARAYWLTLRPHRPTRKEPRIYSSPLVGRRAERERLWVALIEERSGYRAVVIIGEPGVGKSRLTAAMVEDAQASGMSVLAFFGDTRKSTTPYSAMRSLIFEVLSLDEGAADDEIVEALRSANIEVADDSPLGIVLLARRHEGASRAGGVTQTQVARALVETLRSLTEGTSKLIVIEDIHLLDPESMHCLQLLRDEAQGGSMALLATGRPEAAAEAQRIADTVLRLDVLPREEMRELALALWPSDMPSRAMIEQVVDRADGVPFVLEQIILSMGSEDDSIAALVPQSVQSVIHARLNRLSQEAKACAQALSVLGNEIEVDVARRALDVDAETLQRDRADLERLEIIQPSSGTSIRFRHAIVAEACSETLPGARRRQLHSAAIDAISSIYGDVSPLYERLAFHAEGARDDEKALEYLWLAGLRARRSSANGSLFLIFQRAMACIERVGQPADQRLVDFVLMAFTQLLQIGEFTKMKPYLPRALELADRQNRRDRVCAALCNMGTVSWFEGRYEESREQCERALAIAEGLGSLPLTFAAKFMLASALWGMAEMERAIALLFELGKTFSGQLENARLGATAIPASMVGSYLSWFMMEVGRYEEGLPHVERALEIAVRQGEPYSETLARNGLGRNLLKLKRPADAAACLEVAMSLIEQYGYDAIRPHVTGQFASALARIGQARRAVDMVEAWLARGLEERTGRLELYYLNAGYAEALLALGDRGKALAAAENALEVARRLSNPCLIVQGLGLRASLMAAVQPASGAIERDRKEQAELCRRYGLVAET
jgi:class 3 adenylate cyclase/tetratricopeptide (TPR) repeat protein